MSQLAKSSRFVLGGILLLSVAFGVALYLDGPQKATALIVAAQAEEAQAADTASANTIAASPEKSAHETARLTPPPVWMILPFVAMLGAIAVLPLAPHAISHWWESNLHRFYVAALLAAVTLAYFVWMHRQPVEGHWPAHHIAAAQASGADFNAAWTVFANAILNEYVPFIVLLFSLYTICGGIRLEGDLRAHPLTNVAFLAVGAVLASFIGTTGAAMLLIRPLLETNRQRKRVVHTVIFFIFIVCNCGGCLLPLGDPPLFLGYLMGVPFLFTLVLWKEWLFVNGALLVIYFFWDAFWHYPREEKADIARDESQVHGLRVAGLWPNALLLVGIVLSVALLDPSKPVPGTDWRPWLYFRELVQLGLVAASLLLGKMHTRQQNGFNYAAIVEVAALFFGIFITMQPALQLLSVNGDRIGLSQPWHFFWASGALSSFLDNAPTYVVFFTAAKTLTANGALAPAVSGVSTLLLVAVSLGSVFMGANTYIGNGPNFMVKSIAEQAGVKMPSFFGYMIYSCLILIPLFILTGLIFM